MLHAQSIPGSHTGELIYSKYQTMLEEWGIRQEQVHLFVVDNTANMRRAMLDGEIPYLGCFSHTLQLVIHNGVLSQRYVQDILAVCRRIVSHFKRSPLASHRSKEIQASLGSPNTNLNKMFRLDGILVFIC